MTTEQLIDVIYDACKNKGGMFIAAMNLYPAMVAQEAHAAVGGHPADEPDLDER